jgi:hypothetical protein
MQSLRPQVLNTSVSEISDTYLETRNGLVSGSSGRVYIDNLGRAVAIHLKSTDELKLRTTSCDPARAADAPREKHLPESYDSIPS